MQKKARGIAWLTLALGLGVLLVTGVQLYPWIHEEYLIWKLESSDFTQRFRAAKKLGERRATRALPELIELLREAPEHITEAREVWGSGVNAATVMVDVFEQIGPAAVPDLAHALEESRGQREYWRRNACRALGAIRDETSVSPLIELLDDPDACVRYSAINIIWNMGSMARDAIPALESISMASPKSTVGRAAARAIEKIQADEITE